jgi:uncharacterized protein (UPF0335 family)
MSNGPNASQELLLLIERIERLEVEKKGIADDIKDVKSEAKSRGFDVATINAIIKLRKKTPEKRREEEALLDTYKAALGMLDGTPLGKWAMERLAKDDPEPEEEAGDEGAAEAPEEEAAKEPEPTVDDARRLGTEAAQNGKPVTANPFPARDARRAAWDEAWCQELGSDGMDIPEALKPTPKPKKEDASAPDGGQSGENE